MHSRAPLFRSAYNQWELPEAQRRHHMRLSSVKSTYSTQPSKRRRAAAKTKTKFLVKLTDNTGSPLPQNAAPGRRRRRKGNRTARGPASSDKNLLAGAELTPRRPKQLQALLGGAEFSDTDDSGGALAGILPSAGPGPSAGGNSSSVPILPTIGGPQLTARSRASGTGGAGAGAGAGMSEQRARTELGHHHIHGGTTARRQMKAAYGAYGAGGPRNHRVRGKYQSFNPAQAAAVHDQRRARRDRLARRAKQRRQVRGSKEAEKLQAELDKQYNNALRKVLLEQETNWRGVEDDNSPVSQQIRRARKDIRRRRNSLERRGSVDSQDPSQPSTTHTSPKPRRRKVRKRKTRGRRGRRRRRRDDSESDSEESDSDGGSPRRRRRRSKRKGRRHRYGNDSDSEEEEEDDMSGDSDDSGEGGGGRRKKRGHRRHRRRRRGSGGDEDVVGDMPVHESRLRRHSTVPEGDEDVSELSSVADSSAKPGSLSRQASKKSRKRSTGNAAGVFDEDASPAPTIKPRPAQHASQSSFGHSASSFGHARGGHASDADEVDDGVEADTVTAAQRARMKREKAAAEAGAAEIVSDSDDSYGSDKF